MTTRVIGLTGGVGSGKSTVANLFAQHGVPVIDADLIALALTLPKQPAFLAITQHFKEIVQANGSIDRSKLRHIVFEQAAQRQWLEDLLHPLIRMKIEDELKKITAPYCIIVIPLLFEVKPYDFIDRILVVDTLEQNQIQRVMARDKTSASLVEKILHSQINRQQRLVGADDVIINDGKIADIIPQVDQLHQIYMNLSQKKD